MIIDREEGRPMSEEKLFHLLEKKRGILETMLELYREGVGYEEILEHKQILLSFIEEIDRDLKSFQASYTFLSDAIEREMERIKVTIEAILEFEQMLRKKRKQEFGFVREYGPKK